MSNSRKIDVSIKWYYLKYYLIYYHLNLIWHFISNWPKQIILYYFITIIFDLQEVIINQEYILIDPSAPPLITLLCSVQRHKIPSPYFGWWQFSNYNIFPYFLKSHILIDPACVPQTTCQLLINFTQLTDGPICIFWIIRLKLSGKSLRVPSSQPMLNIFKFLLKQT